MASPAKRWAQSVSPWPHRGPSHSAIVWLPAAAWRPEEQKASAVAGGGLDFVRSLAEPDYEPKFDCMKCVWVAATPEPSSIGMPESFMAISAVATACSTMISLSQPR